MDGAGTMVTIILALISLLAGGVGGFFLHVLTMKISFKQRVIEDKFRVYRGLVEHWLKFRNLIYSGMLSEPDGIDKYFAAQDAWYSEAHKLLGETILIADDIELAEQINSFNERFYWAEWEKLSSEDKDKLMDEFKREGLLIAAKMRDDIRRASRFEREDFRHMMSGLRGQKKVPLSTNSRQLSGEDVKNLPE
jgi:hypothetical protein